MANIAKLNALLKQKPVDSNSWPECFNIDRIPNSEPAVTLQLNIGPPTARILIRDGWILSRDLPNHPSAAEYHHGNQYWLPIPKSWQDERNWNDGYWKPKS